MLYTTGIPYKTALAQGDWVDSLTTITEWLNATVGKDNYFYRSDRVCFTRAKDLTLFLIVWS